MSRQTHLIVLGSGADAVSLAMAAARAKQAVTLIEPDTHDLARQKDMLGRHGVSVADHPPSRMPGQIIVDTQGGGAPAQALKALHLAQVDEVGLAPLAPLHLTRLIEWRAGHDLDGCAQVQGLAQALGCDTLRLGSGARGAFPQSAGAQLQDAWFTAADRAMMCGAAPWELDDACEALGLRMGPCELQDLIGLTPAYARRRTADTRLILSDRMVEDGRLGAALGVGWYRYPGGGGKVIDPLIEDLIDEEAHFASQPRTGISDQEMTAALLRSAAETLRTLLERGTLATPHDAQRLAQRALFLPHDLAHTLSLGEPP